MNNHQNAIFHQFENFLKIPLALLGVDLKNSKINKICHFANHPYLRKGLTLLKPFILTYKPQSKYSNHSFRSCWLASTILVNARFTSSQCLVFKPQSGLTHSLLAGMRWAAFCMSSTMESTEGMLGE